MKKDAMKKKPAKKVRKDTQKEESALHQEMTNEIKAYHRAHNRLVNKLIALSGNPTLVLATLHAVHVMSMKYEQEAVSNFIRMRKEANERKENDEDLGC